MTFLGGDTESMREHSVLLRTRGVRLGTILAQAQGAGSAVDWVGPDADALRSRCAQVALRGRVLGERIEAMSQELTEHAQEQDRASEDLAGRLAGMLGGLGGLLGGGAGIGAGAGIGGRLLGGAPTLGGVDGSMLTDAAGVQTPRHDGGEPGQVDHEPLDGEVTDPDENWSQTKSTTVAGGGDAVTGSTTENGDGTTTESVTLSDTQKVKVLGHGEVSMTLEGEVAVTHDPAAGTVSFTISGTETGAFGAGVESGGTGANGEASVAASGSYTVTLPEGSTIDDALAVDLSDPTTLPKGASIAVEDSLIGSFTGNATVASPGVQVGATTTTSVGTGTVTSISHNEDGTYEMSQGEKDTSGTTAGVSIGIPKVAKLEVGTSSGSESATVEHAVFADSPAGVEAMRQAHATGTLPPDTSDAVLERYKDEHTARTNGVFAEGQIGDDDTSVSHSQSSESVSYESVQRTHSDGHQQGIERVFQHGATEYTEKRTETGEETLYVTATDENYPRRGNGNDPTQRDTWDEMYSLDLPAPATEQQLTRIAYTESEVAQMRANEDPTTPSNSELEYMWSRSNQDPTRAAEQMYREYNGLEPGDPVPQDLGQSSPGVPGRTLTPHQTVESVQ